MKIILREKVDSLGAAGEIVNVKPGYARNYLIPRRMATLASIKNIASTQKAIEMKDQKDARTRSNLEALADRLNSLTLKFELKAGEDDKLFGSVTSSMISEAIQEKGYTVDKKEIVLEEPIKRTGNHFVDVKLGQELNGRVKLKISAEK